MKSAKMIIVFGGLLLLTSCAVISTPTTPGYDFSGDSSYCGTDLQSYQTDRTQEGPNTLAETTVPGDTTGSASTSKRSDSPQYYIFNYVGDGGIYRFSYEFQPKGDKKQIQLFQKVFSLQYKEDSMLSEEGYELYRIVDSDGMQAGTVWYRISGEFAYFSVKKDYPDVQDWNRRLLSACQVDSPPANQYAAISDEKLIVLARAFWNDICPEEVKTHFKDAAFTIISEKESPTKIVRVACSLPDGTLWDYADIDFSYTGFLNSITIEYNVTHSQAIPDYNKNDILSFCEQFFLEQRELKRETFGEDGVSLQLFSIIELGDTGEFGYIVKGKNQYMVLERPDCPAALDWKGNPVNPING